MNDRSRQYVEEWVMEEETCATCKYWSGRWRGEIDRREITLSGFMINDTYSTSTNDEQVTYGLCRRFPPSRLTVDKVRSYSDQVKWELLLEAKEQEYDKINEKISEAEIAKEQAEKVANEHPELWDRQMAEAQVKKLAKEIGKLVRRQEECDTSDSNKNLKDLDMLAPKKNLRTGAWIVVRSSDWCGEYKRCKEKTERLIHNLCHDRDASY